MATTAAPTPLQGPLWVCVPAGTGDGSKKEIKWKPVPKATLTSPGSSSSSSSNYSVLRWCDNKDDASSCTGSKNSIPAADLVLVKVHPNIHVAEESKQKKSGWLPSLSFASSGTSLPQAHFAVDALDARALEKALQYGLSPAPPKTYLLGFFSLVDARAWQAVATVTKAAASSRLGKASTPLDATVMEVGGPGVNSGAQTLNGVQGEGRVMVNAPSDRLPVLPAPAVLAAPAPLPTLPDIDLPAAPSFSATSTTSSTAGPLSSIPSSFATPSSSSATTTASKSFEERLHALHHAEQVQRLAALRNLTETPVDEATLRARHAALKGEGAGEGRVEGGKEGGTGERSGHGFLEAATAGLSEEEMVEELLAQAAEEARLGGRECWREEEDEDKAVRHALAAVETTAAEGGDEMGELGHLAASPSAAAPSEAALQRLLQEVGALKAADEGAAVSVERLGQKETGKGDDENKEDEDDPVLARCAALLQVVSKGIRAEKGREGDGAHEEVDEGEAGEEEDGTQLAAVMELARLWAKEGGREGGEEGGEKHV